MKVKDLREQKHLTQAELAEQAGISIRTLQRIEAGQPPKGHTAKVLAKALEVAPKDLREVVQQETKENLFTIKMINLSSLFVTFIPLLNIVLPLIIMYFSKQINRLTKQIVSIQIFWSIASVVLFFLSAIIRKSLQLSNQSSMWTIIILLLINVVIILVNTASLDRKQELRIKLNFSFI